MTAQNTDGQSLSGYTAVLNESRTTIVATAYTPATFTLNNGQEYTVGVDGYGSCRFDYWLDTGNTTEIRSIAITSATQVTAVLDCSAAVSTTSSTTTSTSSSSSSTSSSSSSSSSSTPTSHDIGPWVSTKAYPTSDTGQCVTAQGYVYCIGGGTDDVYYAALTSSGVGAWTATASYPTNITGQACVASGDYIYCISGITQTEGPRPTAAVYYAEVSASGGVVGSWKGTTSYPIGAISLSCAASGGYVYCVGGDMTVGTLETNQVYFAPLSTSGVGNWTSGTNYPISVEGTSCLASAGVIYCFAGFTALRSQPVNSTYYATISSSGVGTWMRGTPYPTSVSGLSCVSVAGYAYCIGGGTSSGATDSVYYAQLSSNGIGAWTGTTSYPTAVQGGSSCIGTAGGVIVCIGGETPNGDTSAVYYTSVESE